MARLEDLQLGTTKIRNLAFSRKRDDGTTVEVTVAMRALTKREADVARANAPNTIRDLKADGRTQEELLEEARIIETLSVACRDPEDVSKPWSQPMTLANMLTESEITFLWTRYVEHQEECSPFISDLTDQQFESMIEKIAAEGDISPFLSCASQLRGAFIIGLAVEVARLRTLKSSSSSHSTELSSDTASEQGSAPEEATPYLFEEMADLRDQIAALTVRLARVEEAHAA